MAKITQIYKAVGNVLQKNTDLLVGKTYDEMVVVLTNTFQNFTDANDKKHWYFRLTYSGDVFSEDFARAMATSCAKFPEVKFWMYTRSFQFVHILVQASNLAVYLSIDPVNIELGRQVYESLRYKHNNIGLAHLGEPKDIKDVKFVKCPETYGKISNTDQRGACSVCKLCFTHTDKIQLRNISFKIH